MTMGTLCPMASQNPLVVVAEVMSYHFEIQAFLGCIDVRFVPPFIQRLSATISVRWG
jgi:hypothetical protein